MKSEHMLKWMFSESADMKGGRVSKHTRREHESRYELALPYVEGKDVLDLGCGYGYGSYILSQKARSVMGVDNSHQGIVTAKERYKEVKNIDFWESDAFDFLANSSAKFDVVVLFEFIEHVTNQEELIELIWKVLKPKGRIFVSTPNRRYTFFRHNPYHPRELQYQELIDLLDRHFTLDIQKGQTPGLLMLIPLHYAIMTFFTSKLGIYRKFISLNDRPGSSRTLIVSGTKKETVSAVEVTVIK